jgi:hypothetical protein
VFLLLIAAPSSWQANWMSKLIKEASEQSVHVTSVCQLSSEIKWNVKKRLFYHSCSSPIRRNQLSITANSSRMRNNFGQISTNNDARLLGTNKWINFEAMRSFLRLFNERKRVWGHRKRLEQKWSQEHEQGYLKPQRKLFAILLSLPHWQWITIVSSPTHFTITYNVRFNKHSRHNCERKNNRTKAKKLLSRTQLTEPAPRTDNGVSRNYSAVRVCGDIIAYILIQRRMR